MDETTQAETEKRLRSLARGPAREYFLSTLYERFLLEHEERTGVFFPRKSVDGLDAMIAEECNGGLDPSMSIGILKARYVYTLNPRVKKSRTCDCLSYSIQLHSNTYDILSVSTNRGSSQEITVRADYSKDEISFIFEYGGKQYNRTYEAPEVIFCRNLMNRQRNTSVRSTPQMFAVALKKVDSRGFFHVNSRVHYVGKHDADMPLLIFVHNFDAYPFDLFGEPVPIKRSQWWKEQ